MVEMCILYLDGGGPIYEYRSEESGGELQDLLDAAAGSLVDYGDVSDFCLSCSGYPSVAPFRFRAWLYFVIL